MDLDHSECWRIMKSVSIHVFAEMTDTLYNQTDASTVVYYMISMNNVHDNNDFTK